MWSPVLAIVSIMNKYKAAFEAQRKRQQVGEPLSWEGKVPSPGDRSHYDGKNILQGLELTYRAHDILISE